MATRWSKAASSCVLAMVLAAGGVGGAWAAPISGQGTWETTLLARDVGGNPVALDSTDAAFFYDTALDITWLANWNVNGPMNWTSANAWAASLNAPGHVITGDFSGWRLPSINEEAEGDDAVCSFGYGGTTCGYNVDTSSSELAHMFYVTLGNLAFYPPGWTAGAPSPQNGWGLTNTAYFTNMQSFDYWSGTEYAPDPTRAWDFVTIDGFQSALDKTNASLYAVAVRSGDVAAAAEVPEPGTLLILLVGLGALAVARRGGIEAGIGPGGR